MTKEQSIINKVDSVIAYADELKIKAAGLRRELVDLYSPAPRKRAGKKVSEEDIAKVITSRRKFLNKAS